MAIKKAQKLMIDRRGQHFEPYQINNRVWLEGTNLTTMHPTTKLLPKQYGPFKVTKVISKVVYQFVTALQGRGSGFRCFRGLLQRSQGDQLLVNIQALNVDCALSFKGREGNGRWRE